WVVEDLHWAGDRLLEMLERVIARATGPLLIIATARPDLVESHPGFGGGSENFSTISLRPLSPRQSDELLRGILDVADLPARLGEEILARAEGNPFFLEEIVRRLIEEGALRREGDRWTAAHGTRSTPLPDSLIALLAARIDSVPEREKRVLQEAAVIGKVFWAEPLQRVMADDVNSALLTLERRGLVSARTTSSIANHTEYSFKHVLVRDVAYASIPKARRARAHAEVGAWIEELAGDRAEQFGELIAYHYALAAVGPDADLAWGADELEHVRHEAFERLVTAGTQARRRFAVSKSLELHEQALPLASNDAEKLRVLEEIADDHTSAYQGDDARRFYFQGLELTRKLGDRGSQARVHAKLADLMTALPGAFKSSPDPKEIEPIIAEGLAGATEPATTASLLISFGQTARLYRGSEPFGQGRESDAVPLEERIAAVEKALAVADSLGDAHLRWMGNDALGILYAMAGRHRESLNIVLKVLPLVEQVGSRTDQGEAVRRAAVFTMDVKGDYLEGLVLARRSLELSRGMTQHQLMHGTNPVMTALYELGRWDEIPPLLEEHLRAFRIDPAIECGFVRDGPILGALVAARSGDLARAHELAALLPDPESESDRTSPLQSRLAVAFGQPSLARALSEGRALEGRQYGPHHARALLEALVALDEWNELERFVPQARRFVGGLAILGPCCDRAEALLRKHQADPTADVLFERAEKGFQALEARAELEATRALIRPASGGPDP
ncbi:MAG TPA: hypothetical protein VHQ03_05405, partial [Candidatus Dormibacteraeota bacterium]|nr:hypothetical protein [Candidatus Dormibacteraeota bacterium]